MRALDRIRTCGLLIRSQAIYPLSYQGGMILRTPNGIRTRVSALRGRCPRPLDDGGKFPADARNAVVLCCVPPTGFEPVPLP